MSDFRLLDTKQMKMDFGASYERIRRFGYGLFAQNLQDKNPVLSPVSAYLALTMAGCGAYGAAKEEFHKVLGKDMVVLAIDIMNTLPAKGDFLNVSFANSAWIDSRYFLRDTWMSAVKSMMNAEVFQAVLSTEETVEVINRWISVNTGGIIDKILERPLDLWTKAAFFSTVYFKGRWAVPFENYRTHKEAFYTDKRQGTAVQADMMCMHGPGRELDYISDSFTEGVILPYARNGAWDAQLALVALKPKGNANMRNICSRLTSGVIKSMLSSRKKMEIELKLPKFSVTFDVVMNKSLANMGLLRCFSMEQANFANILKNTRNREQLFIGLVNQKARITVDENGTEAAAATSLLAPLSAWEAQKKLSFDEPFLYMVLDMDKELPLFIGIMDNPTA